MGKLKTTGAKISLSLHCFHGVRIIKSSFGIEVTINKYSLAIFVQVYME